MYIPVIGLEIHVQVKTNSKMFCRCNSNYFEKEANTHVCPVCFGLPGALPVPNEEAFNKALKLALALECSINKETKFDRKNYFYPDLPKGYQISQYDKPIGYEGFVEIEPENDAKRIRIQRVHLEEDTAKSLHMDNGETLIDYNKSGVALIEIVTHPDFDNTRDVILFAKRLRQILRYLDVSDAEMQKGQVRYELNISIRNDEDKNKSEIRNPKSENKNWKLPNYKVEVKNIGSISVLEKVINYEIKRQEEVLTKGETIEPQTRGIKGMTGETFLQRSKETADDYRYFPEPDIPPIEIKNEKLENIKNEIPELPHQRKARYMKLGLDSQQADIFVEDQEKSKWFDKFVEELQVTGHKSQNADGVILSVRPSLQSKQREDVSKYEHFDIIKEAAKWLIGDVSAQLEKRGIQISNSKFLISDLIYLITNLNSKTISGTIAKDVINSIFEEGKPAKEIVESKGLTQITDSNQVSTIAKKVISENQKVVEDISKNPNAIKFLVGKVMKESQGKINPNVAEEEIRKVLSTKS